MRYSSADAHSPAAFHGDGDRSLEDYHGPIRGADGRSPATINGVGGHSAVDFPGAIQAPRVVPRRPFTATGTVLLLG